MSDNAIKVVNLSKSYMLGHNNAQAERYTALRDVIAQNAKNLARKTRDMLQGKAIIQGDEVEEFWALNDISFEIKQGARVGIIGRNGAGKSTLLKILSRITEPTTGRIQINGRVASLLEVGTGFHPELSGRENIFLNGAILGMARKEIQRKFDEIVAFAEIDRFIDTPVKRYSSGMYVRLAFAVAAHIEPEVLIVDEVLAVGDAQFQKKCMRKMEEVSQEGHTILFVSHNFAAIRALCDSAILLERGALVMQGGVGEVVGEYMNRLQLTAGQFKPLVAPRADVLSIRLCNAAGHELQSINTDTEIYFTITYQVKEPGRVNMVLNLSKEGAFVFQSINNHDPSYAFPKNSGIYISTCRLPAAYLNNGVFVLSMTVFEDNFENPRTFLEIMSFVVDDAPSVRGDYFGGLVGCTRPLLDWRTQCLEISNV
ncbi:polysaccharide ABC transporter ATP-binding protein [Limnohabitans sp. 2KL-3]|uniref:ABC transporter ATP-binding protein n=1 Tax=Limnohabitans sp. 2KL-3 TaxID=1100700 RepID=UPI000A9D34EC|nr:polysaccharide ABC transporter ATP-binding protein [Limnohabitans sp. 2KL-3]